MKILFAIAFLLISVAGISQNKNVTPVIKTAFTKAFNNVSDVKWEKEGKSYEVNFVQNANKMSAVIDEQGKILEIESEIKISSLLPQILSYMNENYKGKELIGASKINNENGSIHYEALIKGKGIVFDSKGAFLKVTKD